MDRMTRSLRVFSPYFLPDPLEGVVSVCAGFNLRNSMRRADMNALAAKDQDDAGLPLDLLDADGAAPSPPLPASSHVAIAALIMNGVANVIDMCSVSSASASASPSLSTLPTVYPSEPTASPLPSTSTSATEGPSLSSIPPTRPSKTGRNKRVTNRRRRQREDERSVEEEHQGHPATREPLSFPQRLIKKYGAVKETVKVSWFSVPEFAHAVGAFIGLRVFEAAKGAGWTAEELLKTQGFTKSFALVDSLGHIIARCIGFPPDPDWTSYCEGACAAMDQALKKMATPQNDPNGRRGLFETIYTGFSMGGGQRWPMPIDMRSVKNKRTVQDLCQDPNIQRIAHHGSTSYAFTSPKAFSFIDMVLSFVEKKIESLGLPSLFRPFPFSVFPAVTFNLGWNVWTHLHRDYNNLIFGMSHGNTPLADPETEFRKSFTQYVPGGLVRWWAYGYRTAEEFEAEDRKGWAKMRREADTRWEEACGMFSKVEDLQLDVSNYLSIIPEPESELEGPLEDENA
ncbi:uncharacterized protein STEHIDRAFT_162949 [Stereum hirsutum FP-91666 SS1]|uniref:Uncharacterized protein n=1 Tax=Stereum hirsutum (strain FP-91666) TaxID=721885 RepID=R7S0J2_STEHR|nr:uncharacterized protein STEHIDRAFT_162949 [Stereum hirsutum FP-91666 SS1]EIM80062.1 hypothetical protein STEHIDRAFT_162949 [Stereum hirsutum FP-91666 SS1]